MGYENELTAVLRGRGELAGDSAVLSAWGGRLLELSGAEHELDRESPPLVLFGVTERSGYLLSALGVLGFELAQVCGAHSPYPGHLRFAIRDGASTIDVRMAIPGAVALAAQLTEQARTPAPSAQAVRRPAPKRRDEV